MLSIPIKVAWEEMPWKVVCMLTLQMVTTGWIMWGHADINVAVAMFCILLILIGFRKRISSAVDINWEGWVVGTPHG
jgi:hypothetical protein